MGQQLLNTFKSTLYGQLVNFATKTSVYKTFGRKQFSGAAGSCSLIVLCKMHNKFHMAFLWYHLCLKEGFWNQKASVSVT